MPPGRVISVNVGRPAARGVNLEGVDCTGAEIGERWRIGTAELVVTASRVPCAKLAAAIGEPTMVRRFTQANRPGAYLGIAREGELGAGDDVEVVHRPGHGVTVGLVAAATLLDPSLLPRLEPARADFTEKLADWIATRTPSPG